MDWAGRPLQVEDPNRLIGSDTDRQRGCRDPADDGAYKTCDDRQEIGHVRFPSIEGCSTRCKSPAPAIIGGAPILLSPLGSLVRHDQKWPDKRNSPEASKSYRSAI